MHRFSARKRKRTASNNKWLFLILASCVIGSPKRTNNNTVKAHSGGLDWGILFFFKKNRQNPCVFQIKVVPLHPKGATHVHNIYYIRM